VDAYTRSSTLIQLQVNKPGAYIPILISKIVKLTINRAVIYFSNQKRQEIYIGFLKSSSSATHSPYICFCNKYDFRLRRFPCNSSRSHPVRYILFVNFTVSFYFGKDILVMLSKHLNNRSKEHLTAVMPWTGLKRQILHLKRKRPY